MGAPAHATVLVVEDDAAVAATLARALEHDGFDVDVAGGVEEALAQARLTRPSLVLLDWCLPGGAGQDVVRGVHAEIPAVPIIVISGARGAIGEEDADARRALAGDRSTRRSEVHRLLSLVRQYAR